MYKSAFKEAIRTKSQNIKIYQYFYEIYYLKIQKYHHFIPTLLFLISKATTMCSKGHTIFTRNHI